MPLTKDEFIIKMNTHICPHLERSQYCTFCIVELANEVYESNKLTVERVKGMIECKINESKLASKAVCDTKDHYLTEIDILEELLKEIDEAEDENTD